MDWLKAVSQLVAKEGQPMSWITPLGLPVLQPYRRTDQFQVKVMYGWQKLTMTLGIPLAVTDAKAGALASQQHM